MLASALPELEVRRLTRKPGGWDHAVWAVNGRYVLRVAKRAPVGRADIAERNLLDAIADRLPLRVPRPVRPVDPCELAPYGATLFTLVPGRPLPGGLPEDSSVPGDVGRFLAALHAIPVEVGEAAGLESRLDRHGFAEVQRNVFPLVSPMARAWLTGLYEHLRVLEHANPAPPAILHADLSHDHIFAPHPAGPVTGVIDFGDACIGDAASDWRGMWAWGLPVLERVATAAGLEDRSVLERSWITVHNLPADHIRFGLSFGALPYGLELVRRSVAEVNRNAAAAEAATRDCCGLSLPNNPCLAVAALWSETQGHLVLLGSYLSGLRFDEEIGG
ncbi:MAG: aminoglycoside phosphotransferase family protein [Chloroflexi bacterium]|nr:aminoglycoside phosphotransferase family protein [Chloroflexota bacterium]